MAGHDGDITDLDAYKRQKRDRAGQDAPVVFYDIVALNIPTESVEDAVADMMKFMRNTDFTADVLTLALLEDLHIIEPLDDIMASAGHFAPGVTKDRIVRLVSVERQVDEAAQYTAEQGDMLAEPIDTLHKIIAHKTKTR